MLEISRISMSCDSIYMTKTVNHMTHLREGFGAVLKPPSVTNLI